MKIPVLFLYLHHKYPVKSFEAEMLCNIFDWRITFFGYDFTIWFELMPIKEWTLIYFMDFRKRQAVKGE